MGGLRDRPQDGPGRPPAAAPATRTDTRRDEHRDRRVGPADGRDVLERDGRRVARPRRRLVRRVRGGGPPAGPRRGSRGPGDGGRHRRALCRGVPDLRQRGDRSLDRDAGGPDLRRRRDTSSDTRDRDGRHRPETCRRAAPAQRAPLPQSRGERSKRCRAHVRRRARVHSCGRRTSAGTRSRAVRLRRPGGRDGGRRRGRERRTGESVPGDIRWRAHRPSYRTPWSDTPDTRRPDRSRRPRGDRHSRVGTGTGRDRAGTA